MKHEEVAFLLANGYTVSEIMQLDSSGGSDGTGGAGTNEQRPAPEQQEAAGELELAESAETPPESSEEIQSIQAEIAELKKAMQAQNIKTISTPSIPGADDSTEKILAEFIRPPLDNKETK